MTGAAAAYGSTQKNGVQLAADEINAAAGSEGLKVTPIFDDDASVPQQGINVFNKFIIARGLMAHPKLLLLDEPSQGLARSL